MNGYKCEQVITKDKDVFKIGDTVSITYSVFTQNGNDNELEYRVVHHMISGRIIEIDRKNILLDISDIYESNTETICVPYIVNIIHIDIKKEKENE